MEPFRDPTEGAKARRRDLLTRRRDDLATMPHVIRRVFVKRSARAAAGAVLFAGGVLIAATAMSMHLTDWFASVLPGPTPAVLSTLLLGTAIGGVVAYMLARSLAEHRFAVAMSRYVLPGEDLNVDIERLSHERPDSIARQMADRLERRSVAWPLAAVGAFVPATLGYLFAAALAGGYPSLDQFEFTLHQRGLGLAVGVALGVAGAFASLFRRARSPRLIGLVYGLAMAWVIFTVVTGGFGAFLLGLPLIMLLGWGWLLRRVGVERRLLASDDPNAGADMFELRQLVQQIGRAAVVTWRALTIANARRVARATLGFMRRRAGMAVVTAGVLSVTAAGVWMTRPTPPAAIPSQVLPQTAVEIPSVPALSALVAARGSATINVRATLEGAMPVESDGVLPAGFSKLPIGWRMSVTVAVDNPADLVGPLFVSPVLDDASVVPRQLTSGESSITFQLDNCDGPPRTLGLRVEPYGRSWTAGQREVHLTYTPVFAPLSWGECAPE